jgi:hypothetical protein
VSNLRQQYWPDWLDGYEMHNLGVPITGNPCTDLAERLEWEQGWKAAQTYTRHLAETRT